MLKDRHNLSSTFRNVAAMCRLQKTLACPWQAKDFGFTRVFGPTAGQKETYELTMKPLVDDVFAAQNALLFAYGMTNAGKTYTVMGEEDSPGLIPQALT